MKHFVIALATIIVHKAVTGLLSISYHFFSEPFDLFKLLLDLLVFAAVYSAIGFVWSIAGFDEKERR